MSDGAKARELFHEAGLAFPKVPKILEEQLVERSRWVYSTMPLEMSPYNLQYYVHQVEESKIADYAVLANSGHGVNSYAIQYYLVLGPLQLFLHLGWGGIYEDVERAAAQIRDCFATADEIVQRIQDSKILKARQRLTIVASEFYGSYWVKPGARRKNRDARLMESLDIAPLTVLIQALDWINTRSIECGTANRTLQLLCDMNRVT